MEWVQSFDKWKVRQEGQISNQRHHLNGVQTRMSYDDRAYTKLISFKENIVITRSMRQNMSIQGNQKCRQKAEMKM